MLLITLQRLRAGELRQPEQVVSFRARNCTADRPELRRGPARREQLLEAYLVEEASEMNAEISSEAQRQRLLGCLRNLTERERSVVLLTFTLDKPTAIRN